MNTVNWITRLSSRMEGLSRDLITAAGRLFGIRLVVTFQSLNFPTGKANSSHNFTRR